MTAPTGSVSIQPAAFSGTGQPLPRATNLLLLAAAVGHLAAATPSFNDRAVFDLLRPSNSQVIVAPAPSAQDGLLVAIADLHDRLLASAQPLSNEAARVLHENLWDLYLD